MIYPFLLTFLFLCLLPSLITFFGRFYYKVLNRHPGIGFDYVHYNPPTDLSLLEINYLFDNEINNKGLAAAIISLEERGFISINKISVAKSAHDYVLHSNVHVDELFNNLEGVDQSLLLFLFNFDGVENFGINLSVDELKKFFSIKRENSISQLRKNKFLLQVMQNHLEKEVKESLVDREIIFQNKIFNLSFERLAYVLILGTFLALFSGFSFYFEIASGLITILPFFTVFFFILSFISFTRYTNKGWKTKYSYKGFKDFLIKTKKDKFNTLNNPHDMKMDFLSNLSYAVVFGINKKWKDELSLFS